MPIHLQPYMVEKFGYQEGDFPITEDLGRRGLAIPFSGVMTEAQVEIVCNEIQNGNRVIMGLVIADKIGEEAYSLV